MKAFHLTNVGFLGSLRRMNNNLFPSFSISSFLDASINFRRRNTLLVIFPIKNRAEAFNPLKIKKGLERCVLISPLFFLNGFAHSKMLRFGRERQNPYAL